MRVVRRLLSIALLAVFGLPFLSPLLALSGKMEGNLPVCCRRNGMHHCMASHGMSEGSTSPGWSAHQTCPYRPASLFASQHSDPGLVSADAIYADLVSHPSVRIQIESLRRIARDRSRHKRGPPSLILL
jgi:hypothetical protein